MFDFLFCWLHRECSSGFLVRYTGQVVDYNEDTLGVAGVWGSGAPGSWLNLYAPKIFLSSCGYAGLASNLHLPVFQILGTGF